MQQTSLFVIVLLVGLSAVLSLESSNLLSGKEKEHLDKKTLGDLPGGMAKFIPFGDRFVNLKTVKSATKQFFNAWQVHDYSIVMRFVNKHSQFLLNSLLPSNGYYKGKHGYLKMFDKWHRTVSIKDATYHINFVDEARQVSVVTYSCSGVFRNNGVNFDNIKAMIFIKWDLGKISKWNLVELTPERTYSLFLSKAHKQFNKLLEGLYLGGNGIREAIDRYVSNDIFISLNNVYPLSLLVPDVSSNATKYEGKDMIATIKGKDNAMKLAVLGDKLLFNLTDSVKVLYSDDTTVVTANIWKPTTHLFLPSDKKSYWKTVTIVYAIHRFDSKGMLCEMQWFINRPIVPYQLRYINELLVQYGDESLYSLLSPFRGVIKLEAAKALEAAMTTDATKTPDVGKTTVAAKTTDVAMTPDAAKTPIAAKTTVAAKTTDTVKIVNP